MDLQPTFNEFG
jgi:hypothetical protein